MTMLKRSHTIQKVWKQLQIRTYCCWVGARDFTVIKSKIKLPWDWFSTAEMAQMRAVIHVRHSRQFSIYKLCFLTNTLCTNSYNSRSATHLCSRSSKKTTQKPLPWGCSRDREWNIGICPKSKSYWAVFKARWCYFIKIIIKTNFAAQG